MRLSDILSVQRIAIDARGERASDKSSVIRGLSRLLCQDSNLEVEQVEHQLLERERLQSTGIGDGVAIPHTSLDVADAQRAALVLCPEGVDFEAIDGKPAYIFFGVVGPKRAASEHLKILAKVSRLLKSPETRRRLLESRAPEQAYSLISEHEASPTHS